jgi:hypothetical protein
VDVAAAGALVGVAAEVAAEGFEEVDWPAGVLDAAVVVPPAALVVDPPELVPGVHPASSRPRVMSVSWPRLAVAAQSRIREATSTRR